MRKIIAIILIIIGFCIVAYSQWNKPLDKTKKIDKILVIKHERRMMVLSHDSVVKVYKISLGRNPVGKKQFGTDMKTPEGLYYINDKNPNSGYHKNLGISYPNKEDVEYAKKMNANPGGNIKIHGIKNGRGWMGRLHLLMDWTLGCIAVTDSEIDELYDAVKIGTPIEIRP